MTMRARAPQRHKRAEHLTGARDVTDSCIYTHTRVHTVSLLPLLHQSCSVWGGVKSVLQRLLGGVGWDTRSMAVKRGKRVCCFLTSDQKICDNLVPPGQLPTSPSPQLKFSQ